MMCELTQVYVKFDDENQRRVILELIKMLRTSMKENLPQLGKNWGRHYLECLITHFDHADCEICALSDSLREKSSFETSSEKRYINQWPQQHPFHIFPFLSQESEAIRFTFPTSRFLIFKRKHITEDSPSILLKTTQIKARKNAGQISSY